MRFPNGEGLFFEDGLQIEQTNCQFWGSPKDMEL